MDVARKRNKIYWFGKYAKKAMRSVMRLWRRSTRTLKGRLGLVALCLALLTIAVTYNQRMTAHIDPAAYEPLLSVIAKGESKGSYNAYFGDTTNDRIRFTEMTLEDVLRWQDDFVNQGNPSSAVGKYQIIKPTLQGLVDQLGIDLQTRYDEALQDRMAIALMERRGAVDYIKGDLSREQFAANLAKEWAALPKVIGDNPEQSYYAGDGLNKSQISVDMILGAIAQFERNAAL